MYRLTSYLSLEEILAVYDPFGDNFGPRLPLAYWAQLFGYMP